MAVDTSRLAQGPIDKFQAGDNKSVIADTNVDKNVTDSSI